VKLELAVSDVGITLETGQAAWETARDLLARTGLCVTHPRLRRDLAGKPGILFREDRALIAPELFAAHYPSPFTLRDRTAQAPPGPATPPAVAPDTARVNAGGFSMDVVDWRSGAVRPATVADLTESVRIVEAAGCGGPYCVTPQDAPPMLRDVVTYKCCFENGRAVRAAYYSNPRQSRFIERMCAVMGEPFDIILATVSPLKMSDMDLDNLYDSADRGKEYPVRIVGYGVPGIGSPAGLAAGAALVMAENYGAAILLSAVFPGRKVHASVSAGGATDFRHCCYALGAPHAFAYRVVNAHLGAALAGRDPRAGVRLKVANLHTGACLPDEQAAAEKMTAALLHALLGARQFECAGSLAIDDLFSLEQFILDREIAAHAVKTVLAGTPSALMADLGGFFEEMESVLAGGMFLSLPSTLKVMRAFYRPSPVFEHMKLRTWQGAGAPTLRQKAQEIIRRTLAESTFVLDADRKKALDAIYREAEKALT
jgi:trimethylamine:corrinoid methyltransferase-like protein